MSTFYHGSEFPTFAVLTAATTVPVTYMIVLDGPAYSLGGVTGTLALDASIGIAACLLTGFLLSKLDRKPFKPAVENASLVSETIASKAGVHIS